MPKITVRVDDQTYRDIRTWCVQRDTCISHVVQAFLNDLPRIKNAPGFPLPYAPAPRRRATQAELKREAEIRMTTIRSAPHN